MTVIPGRRPSSQEQIDDALDRIGSLERARAGSQGCGLPCPPWTVDYDTGEVTGTSVEDGGVYQPPLTLHAEVATGTGIDAGLLALNLTVEDNSTSTGQRTTINAGSSVTIVGAATSIVADEDATVDGDLIEVEVTTGTVTGSRINARGGESSTVLGISAIAHVADFGTVEGIDLAVDAVDSANAYGEFAIVFSEDGDAVGDHLFARSLGSGEARGVDAEARANSGDAVAGRFKALSTSGVAYAIRTVSGHVEIALQTGEKLTVLDSSSNPALEVRADGTVHTAVAVIVDL